MDMESEVEDYLKAIYILSQETDGLVQTSSIAEFLGVSDPSVSSMLNELSDQDLVDYARYRGVSLTRSGEKIALKVVRYHRLLETFLVEELGYDWSEVHNEAERLEHHISSRFADRVAEQLSHPSTDPHGYPIPGEELKPPENVPRDTLLDYDRGDRVRIERVKDQGSEILDAIKERQIELGSVVEIHSTSPLDTVEVIPQTEKEPVVLSNNLAEIIEVSPVERDN